jgi:molybdopterin synthase sulfur carrier subunit
MELKVLFYGILAEVTGSRIKTYYSVSSYGDLLLRLRDDFPELQYYSYRTCINNTIVDGEASVSDGDEVVLLPPFYGG